MAEENRVPDIEVKIGENDKTDFSANEAASADPEIISRMESSGKMYDVVKEQMERVKKVVYEINRYGDYHFGMAEKKDGEGAGEIARPGIRGNVFSLKMTMKRHKKWIPLRAILDMHEQLKEKPIDFLEACRQFMNADEPVRAYHPELVKIANEIS